MRLLRFRVSILACLGCAFLVGCDDRSSTALPLVQFRTSASPAAPGSAEPNLFAAGNHIYLSWLEPLADGIHALRFARWDSGVWSDPRTIAQGSDYFVNWADFPSIVELPDGSLAAHWLVRSGSSTYAYDVHVARSPDDGRSWSEAVIPHRDSTQTEHGFVSLFPGPVGTLSVVWLDGRKYADVDSTAATDSHSGGTGEMTLRHAAIDANGAITAETMLDGRTCDCCQTAAALTTSGPIIVYRDRSAEEIRDISIIRLVGGEWTEPTPVHRDGWRIAACPVNGPSVDADGEKVVVSWFTAANETPRVKVAFSDDAGVSFGKPLPVDTGEPVGRVDAELLPDGSALVTWLERAGDGAEIRVRRIERDGSMSGAQTVAVSSAARASGFPQMARIGDRLVFAWTEASDPPAIRLATARLAVP